MNSSLFTGVLGLKNHQTRMDVIGNNIANVNTYGFKRGRATFADMLSRTYYAAAAPRDGRGGINPLQVGLGVTTAAVTNIMNQGQLEMTGRLTDVAIDGNGWFVLKDGSGSTVYTRDGSYGLDREGSLVNASGLFVQGWSRVETTDDHDFVVDTQRPVDNISFQYGEKLAAAATNKVGLKSNLDEHSRSLIADGIDPKEGFATRNDLLVDLYSSDPVNPTHLGLREGDWIEIHVDTRDISAAQKITNNNNPTVSSMGTGTSLSYTAAFDGTSQTIYSYTGLIDKSMLPMVDSSIILTDSAGNMIAGNRSFYSPQQLAEQKAQGNDFWTIDPNSGVVYSTQALGTTATDGADSTLTFNTDDYAENTFPYESDKFLYFQISNDTTIGDLENTIQNALDSLDVNGTMKAKVKFNSEDATFEIYNDPQSGTRDINDLHVEINAVSGAGIRRGYLLRESTYPTLSGTRLGITNGSLGGVMTREVVGTFDYQTSVQNLDYGNVNGSTNLYAQVLRSHLTATYAAGTASLDVGTAGEWTGYTGAANDLKMVNDDINLTVDGTTWTKVNVFTGASNEYRVSTSGTAGVPAIVFNTDDANKTPSAGAGLVLSYRTDGAPNQLLTEGTDYTVDSTTGRISIMWNATTPTASSALAGAGFTGTIRLSADYTTEDRSLVPPGALDGASVDGSGILDSTAVMNNRWADFAYEFAEVSTGGAGNARTEFNGMFAQLNTSRSNSTAATPSVIADQATSSQPTMITTSRFQSAETYRTSIDVFDSLGDTHTLQFIFTHVGSNYDLTEMQQYQNRWYWRAELPYSDTFAFDSMEFINESSATASLNGELQFHNNGLLKQSLLGGNIGPIMFDSSPIGSNGNSTGAVDTVAITLDVDGHGSPIDGITQYASDFTTRAYEQNGWAMGILETFAVDQSGVIEGQYSNNVVKPIAQIALAMFPNEEGLTKAGNNLFKLSANTGLPAILPAHVGGAGSIVGGSLEQSNVDIVDEFTNMIITERGFQANSRIITTSDEMLVEVINLKR